MVQRKYLELVYVAFCGTNPDQIDLQMSILDDLFKIDRSQLSDDQIRKVAQDEMLAFLGEANSEEFEEEKKTDD